MSSEANPSLDLAAGRLIISRRLIPVAMQLHNGPQHLPSRSETEALEAAGIVVDGDLHPLANAILATMVDPELVATVECTSLDRPPRVGTAWGRGATGVIGEALAPETFTLHQASRGLLPFHVASLLEVGPRPTPGHNETVTVDTELLSATRPHWQERDRMRAVLVDHDVPEAAATALSALHASRRSSWRVSCLRRDPAGIPRDSEVLVVDAGPGGYWSLAADVEAPDTVTFTPLRWSFVIDLLGELLSSG